LGKYQNIFKLSSNLSDLHFSTFQHWEIKKRKTLTFSKRNLSNEKEEVGKKLVESFSQNSQKIIFLFDLFLKKRVVSDEFFR